MKGVYSSVIEAAKLRVADLEASIESQKKFNELYIQMISDSNDHVEKIKEWRNSETVILEGKLSALSTELAQAQGMISELKKENQVLKQEIEDLKEKIFSIHSEIGPYESMARSNK